MEFSWALHGSQSSHSKRVLTLGQCSSDFRRPTETRIVALSGCFSGLFVDVSAPREGKTSASPLLWKALKRTSLLAKCLPHNQILCKKTGPLNFHKDCSWVCHFRIHMFCGTPCGGCVVRVGCLCVCDICVRAHVCVCARTYVAVNVSVCGCACVRPEVAPLHG